MAIGWKLLSSNFVTTAVIRPCPQQHLQFQRTRLIQQLFLSIFSCTHKKKVLLNSAAKLVQMQIHISNSNICDSDTDRFLLLGGTYGEKTDPMRRKYTRFSRHVDSGDGVGVSQYSPAGKNYSHAPSRRFVSHLLLPVPLRFTVPRNY